MLVRSGRIDITAGRNRYYTETCKLFYHAGRQHGVEKFHTVAPPIRSSPGSSYGSITCVVGYGVKFVPLSLLLGTA